MVIAIDLRTSQEDLSDGDEIRIEPSAETTTTKFSLSLFLYLSAWLVIPPKNHKQIVNLINWYYIGIVPPWRYGK